MDAETLRTWLPIGISALSLVLAGVALGWNVYRDVILKARVAVGFSIVSIVQQGGNTQWPTQLRISATNHGPGPVVITGIGGRIYPLWRRLLRRPKYFQILPDYSNPLNKRLPIRLEPGESATHYLPYDRSCFLGSDATHIGVIDSYGRELLAPAKDIQTARRQWEEDYKQLPDGPDPHPLPQ